MQPSARYRSSSSFLADNPVVGNQDAGNRTKPARVTEQPYVDVAGWSARSFHGWMAMPRTPVIRPPVLKLMKRGRAFAKSLAGETTLAAMLTASVATTAVNIEMATMRGDEKRRDKLDRIPDCFAVDDDGGARDEHPHRRKH